MASQTTYLITGANRGIGKQMTASLLLRPATTVIATVRDPNHETSASLHDLPVGSESKLIVVPYDVRDDAAPIIPVVKGRGVEHIDVVVANAGNSAVFTTVLETDPQTLRDDYETNAVGVLRLFQSCWGLMQKADQPARKFVLVTSSVGSIAGLEQENMPGVAYGASKAAANWLAKKISVEFKDQLKVGIIHPGWVQTGMGQSLADAVGFKEPPMTVEDSSRQVLEQIDNLNAETSGQFLMFNGQVLPW